MNYDLSPMRFGVLSSRKCYGIQTKAFILTMTWMSLLIIYGLSATMSPAQAQPRAYVVDDCSNRINVIDMATNSIMTTIPLAFSPSGVALTPDGTRAYVPNHFDDSVSVIDTATNTLIWLQN